MSYQPQLKDEEFQLWCLVKHEDESATVICTDGSSPKVLLKSFWVVDTNNAVATYPKTDRGGQMTNDTLDKRIPKVSVFGE